MMAIPIPQPVFAPTPAATVETPGKTVQVEDLSAWYGPKLAIEGVSISFEPNKVTAIIGPSGCGKSTLVRCINRMHEVVPGGRVAGKILLDGEDIYAPGVDPVMVR